jgi:hypothetical protein
MWFSVDIEADGPIPGEYSMVQLGAVLIDKEGKLDSTFYTNLNPISDNYKEDALHSFNCTREETLVYTDPMIAMQNFATWIQQVNFESRPMFLSDNNGFDWMFTCYYFHRFLGSNLFGHSSFNLGSFYKGIVQDMYKNFKHLRDTKHTHNPVDDAKGNAEAFLKIVKQYKVNPWS